MTVVHDLNDILSYAYFYSSWLRTFFYKWSKSNLDSLSVQIDILVNLMTLILKNRTKNQGRIAMVTAIRDPQRLKKFLHSSSCDQT